MSFLSAVKRRPQRYIDVFSEAEVDDLVALPLIDSVLMLALVDAGLRKSEASALQVRRLKVDTGELVVVAGKGGKDRVVPVTARLRRGVQELLLFERLEPNAHLWYSRPGGGKVSRHALSGRARSTAGGGAASSRPASATATRTWPGTRSRHAGFAAEGASRRSRSRWGTRASERLRPVRAPGHV